MSLTYTQQPAGSQEDIMGRSDLERVIDERRRAVARVIGEQLREARLEPGLSLEAVARAAGLDPSHLLRIERQERLPSLPALVAIATALGREVSIRLYPSAGPRVRDHIQARMIEALLEVLNPRWLARLEVPVYRPVRGVIDVLLQDRQTLTLVAGEGHSQLRGRRAPAPACGREGGRAAVREGLALGGLRHAAAGLSPAAAPQHRREPGAGP